MKNDIFTLLAKINTRDEVRALLTDLCTPKELSDMNDRWQAAQLISEGVSYREIYERTGVSTTTVTRVARSFSEGWGYKKAIEIMKK